MGLLMDLKNRLQTIDDAINHYEFEKLQLKDNFEMLKMSLDVKFGDRLRNMEEELDLKMKREIDSLRNIANKRINDLRTKYDKSKSDLESRISELNTSKLESIKEDCTSLDFLISNKDKVLSKLNELGESPSEIRAIINKNQIPKYSRKQILQLFEDSKEVEKSILELSLDSIKPDFINKEFWFPAGKLDTNEVHPNIVVTVKFLNVLGVITVVTLYSNIIAIGLLGMLSYLGIKNRSKWKMINQYRNWIYTIYEYESDFRKVIEEYHEESVREEVSNLQGELEILLEDYTRSVEQINTSMEQQINALKDDFANQKEKKIKEVKEEINLELQNLTDLINSSYKEIATLTSIFGIEAMKERKKIENVFNELNKFELNIVNRNKELSLKRFHLGVEVGSEDVNYFEDLPFSSYLFVHTHDKGKMRDLMKYLACQFASRLKGDLLTINILDPISYGEGLSEIVDEKSIGQYYNENEVSEFIDQILTRFTRDIKSVFTGYDNLMQYNKDKIEVGSTPYPYVLNLIQNVDIFSDIDRFKQLLQTKKSGVINLILVSADLIEEVKNSLKDSEVKRAEFLELMELFGRLFTCSGEKTIKTGSINWDTEIIEVNEDNIDKLNEELGNKVLNLLDKVNNKVAPYEVEDIPFKLFNMNVNMYNYEELDEEDAGTSGMFDVIYVPPSTFRNYGKLITENIEDAVMNIFYYDEFIERIVPKGKEMTFNNTKGILMPFGYKDGDVEKLFYAPIDDETIHYFMGGRSGMGKSNTLNVGLSSVIRMYSPDDLHIYFMDYKSIEGRKYMVNPTPHFKCISVTSDPYYQISLFDHLLKILYERQDEILPKYNVGKVEELREKGINIPEILVVIDEVTQGFEGDDVVVDKIKESSDKIARLGRASGMHLIYSSQDISNKIPDGMLGQFPGRLCLPVSDAETSKQVLKNDAAAASDFQQKGNLLFNNRAGDINYNVRIKVPKIDTKDMNENFELINSLCEGKYKLECVMFDANEIKKVAELTEFLEKYSEKLKKSKQLVLGGNAQFDTKDVPVGIRVPKEESDNIFITSQGKKMRIELTNTIIQNIAYMEGSETNLVVLRGNKDYIDFNYSEIYKDFFKGVYEMETVSDIMEMMSNCRLAVLESELKEYGIYYDEKSENFSEFLEYENFIETWNRIKQETLYREEELIRKVDIAKLVEAMRPYSPKALILVEGVDEIPGLGVDNYGADEYIPILRYAPYYGVINVWNSSRVPDRFDRLGSTFKHRIVGSLREADIALEYKFMKGNENYYGGYKNIINPDNVFKFKIYQLDGISDDMKLDNRILVKEI